PPAVHTLSLHDALPIYAAAARRGMIAENTEVQFNDAHMNQMHNVYQYFMGVDSQFMNYANWACRRLAGGNAVHAGPLLTGSKRVDRKRTRLNSSHRTTS